MTRRWRRSARGNRRTRAANTTRSAQSIRGRGLVRRRTATSWRSTRSSTSFVADARPISRTNPSTWRKISTATATTRRDHARPAITAGQRPRPDFWHPTGARPPRAPGAGRRQLVQHRGHLQPAGPGDPTVHIAQAFPHVGGVADHVHDPVGVAGGDQLGQLAGVRDLPGVPGSPQPGQHRQAHRAGQKRQLHDDAGHDPAVAEPDGFRALRGAVVMPRRPEDFLPGPFEQCVVDRDRERSACREQSGHDQIGQGQSERVTRPAGVGEQSVRAAVMPHLIQPGTGEHSTHRSAAGLRDQTDNQPDERLECGSGKARPKHGQETGQRARCGGAGRHRQITLTRTANSGRCCPPHTPRSANHASPACPRDPRTGDQRPETAKHEGAS